jgi:hypothetical protein
MCAGQILQHPALLEQLADDKSEYPKYDSINP